MDKSRKHKFLQQLALLFACYGKTLPEQLFLQAWENELEAFPDDVIAMAIERFKNENANSAFAPTPIAIKKLCMEMDGRPGAEEAWGIAMQAQDERNTVVWTDEIAQAYSQASSLLNDKTAARMTFKEAYTKLVNIARINNTPVNWFTSFGVDAQKRSIAVKQGVNDGLLLQSTANVLFLGNNAENLQQETSDTQAREQLAKIKNMLLTLGKKPIEKTNDDELNFIRAKKQSITMKVNDFTKNKELGE